MLKLVENKEFGQTLRLESVDPELLVREAVDELTPYFEARHQRVEIDVEPNSDTLSADPSKLMDVVINLLANAIKFTPDHGTIRIKIQPVQTDRECVRVVIHDEGVGVHPSDQQYLFEPFFTGFDTLHHSSGDFQFGKRGIGLGLCMVKTFVELHGGRVEVQSTPEHGSSFGFVLPRRPPDEPGEVASSVHKENRPAQVPQGTAPWATCRPSGQDEGGP
jgi:signal transduction histidine kinase